TNGAGAAGPVYGEPTLERLYFGSGGGDSGSFTYTGTCGTVANGNLRACQQTATGPLGSLGGGIILVSAQTINYSGTISALGEAGKAPFTWTDEYSGDPRSTYGSGGGAGGSIRIQGNTITLGTASVIGGAGSSVAGAGGRGYI